MTEPNAQAQEPLHHARYVTEQIRRGRPLLERHSHGSPVAARKLVELEAVEREGHLPLRALDPRVYELPSGLRKTFGKADLIELEAILELVRLRHAGFVGERADVAMCTLAGDEEVASARLRLQSG